MMNELKTFILFVGFFGVLFALSSDRFNLLKLSKIKLCNNKIKWCKKRELFLKIFQEVDSSF